ncbi:MAG: hypothetical protein GY814_11000, partial [Gammaproteobacteria bacterium]|nr:hypothetical protein [Gammaproteobacteria bacterium]
SKKRCTYCKKYFPANSMVSVPAGNFCSKDHLYLYATERTDQLVKKTRKIEKKKIANEKKAYKNNDLRHQHALTQTAFNKMRVLEEKLWFQERGIKPYCISCEATHLTFCCGHYSSRGAFSEHRYSRLNTYLQCNFRCNSVLSANKSGDKTTKGYDAGLVKRFGEEKAKEIIAEVTTSKVKKWTCEELIAMRKEFRELIK